MVSGCPSIGDTIKVVKEASLEWGQVIYPIGSEWIVKEVIAPQTCTVFCEGNDYGLPASHYKVIKTVT